VLPSTMAATAKQAPSANARVIRRAATSCGLPAEEEWVVLLLTSDTGVATRAAAMRVTRPISSTGKQVPGSHKYLPNGLTGPTKVYKPESRPRTRCTDACAELVP
jgi:hypothetical protein